MKPNVPLAPGLNPWDRESIMEILRASDECIKIPASDNHSLTTSPYFIIGRLEAELAYLAYKMGIDLRTDAEIFADQVLV